VNFFKVNLFLMVVIHSSDIFASAEKRKNVQGLQSQQISAASSVRDKLKHLDKVQIHQEIALQEADKSFDQRARINMKILIGEYIVSEVMQTIDVSTEPERALHQQCQSFITDKKDKAECLQWLCLQCFSCCPEREVQELPADRYVEAAQDILMNRSFALHPLRESQIILKEHRS